MDLEKLAKEILNQSYSITTEAGDQLTAVEAGDVFDVIKRLTSDEVLSDIPHWYSVKDRPLFMKDQYGNWICTEDGNGEFIAAIPYNDSRRPNKGLWWIRHCVVEDEIGLCVVGDDCNEPAGWSLEDVTHWMPMPSPPAYR